MLVVLLSFLRFVGQEGVLAEGYSGGVTDHALQSELIVVFGEEGRESTGE